MEFESEGLIRHINPFELISLLSKVFAFNSSDCETSRRTKLCASHPSYFAAVSLIITLIGILTNAT